MGDCQWVIPGRTLRSRSARIASKGSAASGGGGRETGADRARLDRGKHRVPLDALEVVGNPIHGSVGGAAELSEVVHGETIVRFAATRESGRPVPLAKWWCPGEDAPRASRPFECSCTEVTTSSRAITPCSRRWRV